jgi:uncharacterized protein YjbJ (UPF0337 family)
MMDQAKGMANNVVGKAQDAFGGATGDVGTQVQGKVRQAAGKVQENFGDALSRFQKAAVANPAAALAVVAGVGFLLGVLWSRRD